MPDGVWFNEPLTTTGDYYEFTVPDDATTEIPFYCSPHCNAGMTGVIMIDIPQGQLDIGLVDIVNAEPMMFSRVASTETISITGTLDAQTSFFIGVQVEDFDVDVTYSVSSKYDNVLLLDVAAGTDAPLNGSGVVTLSAGQKYVFAGDAIGGDFDFEMSSHSEVDAGASFSAMNIAGHGSVVATGDQFVFRTSGAGSGSMTFEGEGEIQMSVVGEVSSATLTLPPLGEEGIVTVPAGSHDINFQDVAIMTMYMGEGDGGGGGMPEDVNGDCVVDVSDLLQIIGAWGSSCP